MRAIELGRNAGYAHRNANAVLAVLAAGVAAIGDLCMLSIAHGASWVHAGDSRNALVLLWIGGAAGLAIPLYYLGYRYAAHVFLDQDKALERRIITTCGAGVGLFGVVTHLLTAIDIHSALQAGSTVRAPVDAFAPAMSRLFVSGAVSVVAAIAASTVFAWAVLRGQRTAGYLPALLTPLPVTAILIALAASSKALSDYLGPAAPNLAHIVYFGACWLAATRCERRER